MPSPTATAIIGATDCSHWPSKSLSRKWIRLSGFITSVGTSKRSRSTCSRFGVRAQPPETTSSSTGPSDEVAEKKSKVLRISPASSLETVSRTGRASPAP